MLEAILCDTLHGALSQPKEHVAVSLGRQRVSRYEPPPYAPMKKLVESLGPLGLGLIDIEWGVRGDRGRGLRTTISASTRLYERASGVTFADFGRSHGGEPIVLRQVKRRIANLEIEGTPDWFDTWTQTGAEIDQLVSYRDNDAADQLRADMIRLNRVLDEANISLNPAFKSGTIDVGDRWMRRVFNNGCMDFRHGGRLAGGFWMGMPQQDRLRAILIDGSPVAELDYRAMMPRLLYASKGRPIASGDDPYSIPEIPNLYRGGVKTLFAALLFGPTAKKRWPRGCKAKFPSGMPHHKALDLLSRRHRHVAHAFGSLIGYELFRKESDILLTLLKSCEEQGIVALPIHDAVLCPQERADEVGSLMKAVFEEKTGATTTVSIISSH